MTQKLAGRVAIVTGSSMGIGEAVAAEYLAQGAKVVINSRDQGRAEATANKFRAQGYQDVLPIAADMGDRAEVFAMVDRTVREWGRLDVLVNNAGISAIGPSEDLPADQWQRTVDVNLSGCFWGAQAAAKAMIPNQSGNIIMISSVYGSVGVMRRAAYVSTKHALVGLTKTLAVEWAKYHIRVNCLSPGYIWTPLEVNDRDAGISDYGPADIKRRTPMGRYGTSEECAKAAVFLASDDSSYTTGSVLLVDGGWVAYGAW